MLRRIKKIKGVGRFIDAPHIELGKLTLIYGPNCYGKSTLSDILRSIKNQNPEILSNRKSIVRNGGHIEQEIRFGVKTDIGEEKEIFCIGQRWNAASFNYSIEVFDSRFIGDNVFTGLIISRDNKENLTNLLIGEKSVEIGNEIKKLKSELREKTKIIGDLEDLLKRSLGVLDLGINLEKFIEIKKPDDIDDLKSKLDKLTEKAKKLKKSVTEKTKILELEEPNKISIADFWPLIEKIENLLSKSFSNIDNSAYSRMQEHIKQHFKNKDGYEEEWIKKGINSYLKIDQDIQHSKCPL